VKAVFYISIITDGLLQEIFLIIIITINVYNKKKPVRELFLLLTIFVENVIQFKHLW